MDSSWPGLTWLSTSLSQRLLQDVDARDKPGHDGVPYTSALSASPTAHSAKA